MSTRKMTFGFLVLSLAGLVVGYLLKNSTELSFCLVSEPSCINSLTWVGNGLFYGMSALSLVFLSLLFKSQAFPAWKKFAKWFIPIAALIFIFYNGPSSGDYFSPYPEQVFQWVSVLYVVISAGIILRFIKKE